MKYAELIEALRCCIVDFNSTQSRRCNECPYGIYADGKKYCENKAKRDAAAALKAADKRIAELMPKEGEWIEVHDWLHIPQEERGTYRCSACGQVMKYPWNYCPNCGAKMKKGANDEQIH